jgi:homoserine kinase
MTSGIKVIAPATISNLACGFDTLGLALDLPCDEIIGRWVDSPGVHIIEISGEKKNIPYHVDTNTAGIAATALLSHMGETGRGVELKIRKHIPGGSGLGSSAASACAAAVLVNELLNRPLEKRELIPFALDGELVSSGSRHGDNVVPCMIGGLMLIRDILEYDYHRVYAPSGLFLAVLLPDLVVNTRDSRGLLRQEVSLQDMVKQSANLGALIIGMNTGDLDLIHRSLEDHVIEPQRKHLIPFFDQIKDRALNLGALGCSISGAGPALFALCPEKLLAQNVADAMKQVYEEHHLGARTFVSGINQEGVILK